MQNTTDLMPFVSQNLKEGVYLYRVKLFSEQEFRNISKEWRQTRKCEPYVFNLLHHFSLHLHSRHLYPPSSQWIPVIYRQLHHYCLSPTSTTLIGPMRIQFSFTV